MRDSPSSGPRVKAEMELKTGYGRPRCRARADSAATIHGRRGEGCQIRGERRAKGKEGKALAAFLDRKSTRLNSSHANISYAVFCLKKKKKQKQSKETK